MINIVSNSCVGSYLTTQCFNQEFINPFTWNIIDFHSYKILLTEYDSIDFSKVRLEPTADGSKFYAIIDDRVRILYEHYIKDAKQKNILTESNNVTWCNIEDYILSKYTARLKMTGVTPVFVFGSTFADNDAGAKEDLILTNNDRRKLIIIANADGDYARLNKLESKNTRVHLTHLVKNNRQLAFDLFEKYKDFIVSV